ncbi:Gfo/Idh/MocA family oxidoreductase [Brevibacillus nitrificans]|uniref:Gfo/Idh/MocA family protein n=1 Tax=Brevibacillus nitrificans TaxID=651560 RepID=UPI00286330AB|nr:Gfo/Idh/MocA family oxidoreductase [Brevibacillus nitrificans]MDR7316405.1 putative dehydrogenase [Brevibacillus nitrificans]
MKVGIISFAHMHAHSYATYLQKHPDAQFTAIWDHDEERGKTAAATYQVEYYRDLREFLQTDVEAVIVCSENARHKEHVIAAARAQKQILCEKPIATEVKDAEEMIRTCKEEGVILQMAYPVRFAPVMVQVKQLIESKAIGAVLAVNGTNHGQMPGGWFIDEELSGGGAATDHIVHVMDLVRWLLKDEGKSVYAELDTRFYDIDVEDCGIVSLEMESGVIVTIDPSWSRPKTFPTWGDVTMHIVGSKGTLWVDVFKQHALYYNDQGNRLQHLPWAKDMDEGLIADFIQCVQEGRAPSISGEDGLRTLEIVKAAYESNRCKQAVIIDKVTFPQ